MFRDNSSLSKSKQIISIKSRRMVISGETRGKVSETKCTKSEGLLECCIVSVFNLGSGYTDVGFNVIH